MSSLRSLFTRYSSLHQIRDDVVLTDIESANHRGARTLTGATQVSKSMSSSRLHRGVLLKHDPAVMEVSSKFHNSNTPLLVPSFISLRRNLLEHLTESLHRLERDIAIEQSADKVATAISLLQQMDYMIESEIKISRLEDPTHADSQGLSVLHFDMWNPAQSQVQLQPWLMITRKWGEESSTIAEPMNHVRLKQILPDDHLDDLKRRSGANDIRELHPWIVRKKTPSEEQKWSLRYLPDGSIMYRRAIRTAWRAIFVFATVSLVAFYGVGIIATNTTFDEIFKKYFFWIALIWSLASSSLLSWLTVAFGASRRDAVGAFLTGIGIWLVVIQIGQTHLLTQLQSSRSEA